MPAYRLTHWLTIGSAIAAWLAASAIQARIPPSLALAVLDEIAHAAVAIACTAWLVPRWGWTPVSVAVIAGTAIDLDHAVAAGCLAPSCLMGLSARPALHSLAGALAASVVVGFVANVRIAYATAIGAALHVWRDATAMPGVPLWFPFDANAHVLLPTWSLAVAVAAVAAINATIAREPDPIFRSKVGRLGLDL